MYNNASPLGPIWININ